MSPVHLPTRILKALDFAVVLPRNATAFCSLLVEKEARLLLVHMCLWISNILAWLALILKCFLSRSCCGCISCSALSFSDERGQ